MSYHALVVVIEEGETEAWNIVAERLQPLDQVKFVGHVWPVHPLDSNEEPEFGTIESIDQHPDGSFVLST